MESQVFLSWSNGWDSAKVWDANSGMLLQTLTIYEDWVKGAIYPSIKFESLIL